MQTPRTWSPSVPRRQRGASAVEFALIFPIVFAITYGAIVYSYAFVLKQSITFAAQEAAEAAVDVQPGVAGYDTTVRNAAINTAKAVIAWMPQQVRSNVVTSVEFCADSGSTTGACQSASDAVVVTITLPLGGSSQVFASMVLPLVGRFPPLPATMTAQAVARV
jgi:Flp pilus assembly protein TadG